MNKIVLFAITTLFCLNIVAQVHEPRIPLKENPENGLMHTWKDKKLYDSLLIDDMESQTGWSSSVEGISSYTNERSIDGKISLRLEHPFKDTVFIAEMVRRKGVFSGTGKTVTLASLNFKEPQDWSKFDRLSFWIYVPPESDGVQDNLRMVIDDQDITTSPIVTPQTRNYFHNIKAGQWNHIFWEISDLPRKKVSQISFQLLTVGHRFGKSGTAKYDIDHLQLERVEVNKNEGWLTTPGKISFCHTGYTPEESKVAIASSLNVKDFQIINEKGKVVLSKPIQKEVNDRGNYQLIDFSEIHAEGTYFIKAGIVSTKTFRISENVWKSPIEKALNFFYVQRCGFHVPDVHAVCHEDWQGIYNGEKKVINGGWHDAGDLSQGNQQTGLSVYAMLELTSQLAVRGNDPDLLMLAEEESLWGLNWWLKTRFPNGNRVGFSAMRIFTDNIIGTNDDVIAQAKNVPWINFLGSGIEAHACQIFRKNNPVLARKCFEAAKEDWKEAMAGLPDGWEYEAHKIKSGFDVLKLASWGAISSLHLFKLTGENDFAEKAASFGRIIINCQETSFKESIPITGYFYNSPQKKSIVHYVHMAFEESPLLALAKLCEILPEHLEWIKWYGAVVLHSEYFLKRGATYSSPFFMLPASVYNKSELQKKDGIFVSNIRGAGTEVAKVDEKDKAVLIKQIDEGVRLSDNYYLRRFPVQLDQIFHGNTALQLSESVALTQAYKLRNDRKGEQLVTRQMEWVLGNNPFSQSLMYGEGYDYGPLFSNATGNIVGALPVGMDCILNDQPSWYTSNYPTYREVWGVPTGRFLWNMAYIGTPALLNGKVASNTRNEVTVTNKSTKESIPIKVNNDGSFSLILRPGDYRVKFGAGYQDLTMLKGCQYSVNCDPNNYLIFKANVEPIVQKNNFRIIVTAEGKGLHKFKALCFNGRVIKKDQEIELTGIGKKKLYWNVSVTEHDKPWVFLIVPDIDPGRKQELTGVCVSTN